MTITVTETPWIRLEAGDTGWRLNSDLSTTARAVLEVHSECPNEHRWIIQQCLEQGWIQPVAYVPRSDPTLMWDTLNDRTR